MGYQVLARKWRPRSFAELVGQNHVLQALVNALDRDRLHHAYLFTGTRGVGKTTIARIFAKCLNCESGVSATPCGECSSCHEIDEGRFVDLIEVDAASRTKVEDTRELLDNVQYAPTRGRYKVYLIDEVHMLSTHSFNALLKTLEEPPPHVKFLLATTDPQKLPVTILSRCLQFGLKNMTSERIVGHLENVLNGEDIAYQLPALWQLARAADGSMRDALSLTDQAIAFGNGRVNESEVSTMLGSIDQGQVMRMVQALASANASEVFAAVSGLAEFSPDYLAVLDNMLSVLHRIALAQAVPEAVDNSQGDREQVLELAKAMSAEDVQLYYQVGLVGKKDLPLAPEPRGGFEMALLRMLAFRPEAVSVPAGRVLNTGREESSSASQSAGEETLASEPEPEPAKTEQPVAEPSPQPLVETVVPDASLVENVPPVESAPPVEVAPSVELAPPVENVPLSAYDEQFASAMPEPEYSAPVLDTAPYDMPPVDEPVAAPAQPEVEVSQPVVTLADDSAVLQEQKVTLNELNASCWIGVFRSLALGGVTGTIGSHCEYTGHDGNNIRLRLDSQRSTLYNDTHRERIEKVLSDYFAEPIRLQVEIGELESETPAHWRQRKISERLEQAKASIYSDPNVQRLINDFSASVLDQTIEPIGDIIS